MLRKTLLLAVVALVGAATLAASAPADAPSAPAGFYQKNFRLDINLQDVQGLVFDAALGNVPGSVPAKVADYLNGQVGSATFEVDATAARCFIVKGDTPSSVACSQIADMVDASTDGGVDATVLTKPVLDPAGNLGFKAKKITVWVNATGQDVAPPADASPPQPATPPVPAPPKFFKKNIRLDVTLHDVQSLVFDATLYDVPSSVPAKTHDYLSQQLDDSAFEVDATGAKCFLVKHGNASGVPCSQIADLVDGSADGGVEAAILAKPLVDKDGDLGFAAKKITVSQ